MFSNDAKILATFSLNGLIAGLLTVFLGELSAAIIWACVGALFTLALFVSVMIASDKSWLNTRASTRNYIVAAAILILTYPVAFVVSLEIAFAYDWLYEAFLQAKLDRNRSPDEGFLIGLAFAGAASALALALAMRMLTGKWNRKVTILMVIGGVTTIPLAWIASKIFSGLDDFWPHWLLIFGQILFVFLSGYWLITVNKSQIQME